VVVVVVAMESMNDVTHPVITGLWSMRAGANDGDMARP
jgi:hypothetical protein